jgi:hypothetical protein
LAGRVFKQHHGALEIEQDARGARHRFDQAGFTLLARQALAHFGHQHHIAHLFVQALLHRIDRGRRICRRRRDVVGAMQVDAQVGRGLLDLARGAGLRLHGAFERQRAQGASLRYLRHVVRVRRQHVRQAHDADQGVAGLEPRARFVVVQHRVRCG